MSWLQSGHHVVNFFQLVGVSVSTTAHRIQLRILSIALEEELKVLDFASWLNYYYLVSFDCFPLFLHFLTSLIKLILWLNFFSDKRQAEDMGGKDHRVLLCVTLLMAFCSQAPMTYHFYSSFSFLWDIILYFVSFFFLCSGFPLWEFNRFISTGLTEQRNWITVTIAHP